MIECALGVMTGIAFGAALLAVCWLIEIVFPKPVPVPKESPVKEQMIDGVLCRFDADEGIYVPVDDADDNNPDYEPEENPESLPEGYHFGRGVFEYIPPATGLTINHAALLTTLAALGIVPPKAPEPRQPRFTWVRPLLTRLVKALPKASLWAALLGLVFAHEVRLGFLVEGQDATWFNFPGLEELLGDHVLVYIQAGVAALVVALSYVILPGRAKVEHKL